MEDHPNNKAAESFSREFACLIGNVITEVAGMPVTFAVKGALNSAKRNGQLVHFRVCVKGTKDAECFIEIYKHGVIALGSKLLGEDASDYREQHGEAVQHTIATAVARLKTNGDVTFTVEGVSDPMVEGMLMVPLAAAGLDCDLLLYFSTRFQEALTCRTLNAPESTEVGTGLDARNLDLVMDVELNVSLRFGQREMALREVLELESGSVIELNRRVDEPVELLLDGRVIAIGEAVIVDGNYGLRVTKVSQLIASQLC